MSEKNFEEKLGNMICNRFQVENLTDTRSDRGNIAMKTWKLLRITYMSRYYSRLPKRIKIWRIELFHTYSSNLSSANIYHCIRKDVCIYSPLPVSWFSIYSQLQIQNFAIIHQVPLILALHDESKGLLCYYSRTMVRLYHLSQKCFPLFSPHRD